MGSIDQDLYKAMMDARETFHGPYADDWTRATVFASRYVAERTLPVYEGSLDDVVRQVRADFEQLILAHNAGDEGTAGNWVDSIIQTIVVKVAQSVVAAQEAT